MTIVITGAIGQVRRPLVTWLHRRGILVRAVSRQPHLAIAATVRVVA